MSLYWKLLAALACVAVWCLMAHTTKQEHAHGLAVGSICTECSEGICHDGSGLCRHCAQRKRAREIQEIHNA